MLIVCPNCATNYRVQRCSLGAAGRSVRCVRCCTVWFARDFEHDPAISGSPAGADAAMVGASADAAGPPECEGQDSACSAAASAQDFPSLDDIVDSAPAFAETLQQPPFERFVAPFAAHLRDHEGSRQSPAPIAAGELTTTPGVEQAMAPPATARRTADVEPLLVRRPRKPTTRPAARSRTLLPIAALALAAVIAGLIGWRAEVVRAAPQTASLYSAIGLSVNLRGIEFATVATAIESHDGVQVLVVEGTIASASRRPVEVPRLRFSLRSRSGRELYAWTAPAPRSLLAPGETLSFSSRLASPPADARDVLVRFLKRQDQIAGLH